MVKKQVLGKGLSALLKDPAEIKKTIGSITEIDVDTIVVNPFQPRSKFGKEALKELSDSIKELGVIQPITVRKLEDGTFQLVSGERRYRAVILAGLKSIPAYIRLANDKEMLEMALVENIQRQDLDAIEIALSYQKLIEECKLTQEEMSKRVGKDRSTITNYLRLLKLDPLIQTGIRDGMISMAHGRAIVNIENADKQVDVFEKIIENNLSVRHTEELVKNLKGNKNKSNTNNGTSVKDIVLTDYHRDIQKNFTDFFGMKVKLKLTKKYQGKIEISFKSKEDIERIKKLLQ